MSVLCQVKIPVSAHAFNDDTNKIQFAIVSDLWGGNRPGIFEDAVQKLELLQPQFVISVGDLIDGKTYDTTLIQHEWDAFDKSIQPLSMPFFYVPGNHDIGNPVMERQWRKRRGSPYYSFLFKNALFLCINTEDGGHGGIRDEQVAYFKKAIDDNPGVRWTFLFMHRPVWQGKDDHEEGYEKIEALLKGRNYTVFSGHHHTYLNVLKNGNKHFVLGTTGGGIELRGEKFGEFDHVTWVSLGRDAPKIINLKLNGLIREDVVNETERTITETLIDQTWLMPVPKVCDDPLQKSIPATILLTNPTKFPLTVNGDLCAETQYNIELCKIDVTIAPNKIVEQKILISKKDQASIDIQSTPFVDIGLNASYFYNNTEYALPGMKKLLLSYVLPIDELKHSNAQSNSFHAFDTTHMISLIVPEYLDRKWYWTGPEDAWLRFKVIRDDQFIHVLALVNDDQWVFDKSGDQDLLYLHVEDANGTPCYFTYSPGTNEMSTEGNGILTAKDIACEKFLDQKMMLVDIKMPLEKIKQGENKVRMNIGYRDQDNSPEKEYSIFFWKPLWGKAGDYERSGEFKIHLTK